MNYQEAISYLNELNTFGIRLGLDRIRRLTELLDNPEKKYHVIHVTGTNGKGSTTAMIAAVLRSAKIKTGMYTSPHLEEYTERIQIDGRRVSEDDFAAAIAEVKAAVEAMLSEGLEQPTQFEVLTAAALLIFAKQGVEYAVIEVGLGGLLDSTNIVQPDVAVITNISFEHADRCGGSLDGIAEHKAGIIKEGVPVVTAAEGRALEIIRRTAEEKSADVFVLGEDFDCEFKDFDGINQEIAFSADLMGVSMVCGLRLLGIHQLQNCSLAIMTALILGNNDDRITAETLHNALLTVAWPGRFELLELGGHRIIIDGAHNPAGAAVLRQNLNSYFPNQPIQFMLGILKDKDINAIVRELIYPVDSVVVTEPESERAATAEEVAQRITASSVIPAADIQTALDLTLSRSPSGGVICIAGSLYLIGHVRSLLLKRGAAACE